MSHGSSWGGAIWGANSPLGGGEGSLCERTPLGKVVGNLAQAKTGSTQDPFCIKMFCNVFVPLGFHHCDSLKKILIVK